MHYKFLKKQNFNNRNIITLAKTLNRKELKQNKGH